jgi:hypothetical protein
MGFYSSYPTVNGIQEVDGSTPFSSTNKINYLRVFRPAPHRS